VPGFLGLRRLDVDIEQFPDDPEEPFDDLWRREVRTQFFLGEIEPMLAEFFCIQEYSC